MNKRLGVLTYDAPHRKTQDLLSRLSAFGYEGVRVIATPWEKRNNFKPMIPHRPSEEGWPCLPWEITPESMCENLEYPYWVINKEELADFFTENNLDMVLIGGAGILPPKVVKSVMLVNSHPAMLPDGRGLDALKWAIYKFLSVGVTLHIIDHTADAGILIKQKLVPLYLWDTFHSYAMRQYEMEMDLLVNAPKIIEELGDDIANCMRIPSDIDAYTVHRRMPHLKEMIMLRKFEHRRDTVV